MPYLIVLALALCGQEVGKPSITGDFVVHDGFESKVLGNKRTVTVWLPPGYKAGTTRCPVLYMFDGQNVFDGARSFIPNKEWRADETASALAESGLIEPLIIVGIDNMGLARADEYLPTSGKLGGATVGGKADRTAKFLCEELKPFVDKTYRTRPDPAHTGLCGSSFGGIAALYVGLSRPDVFGKLGVVSPSVWWDDGVAVKQVNSLKKKPTIRIWVDTGTMEGEGTVQQTRRLFESLLAKGWRKGKDAVLVVEPGGLHEEGTWARRFGPLLTFLFPAAR